MNSASSNFRSDKLTAKKERKVSMKKIFALIIMLCLVASTVTVPAFAKTKTKNIKISAETNEATVPFYSKWQLKKETVGTDETVFDIPGGGQASIVIMDVEDDEGGKTVLKYLSKKKYRNKLMSYLAKELSEFAMSDEELARAFSVKKDGNGKYLLLIDLTNQYSVIRVLDGRHLLIYSAEAADGEVTKSVKKKLISYAKKTVFAESWKTEVNTDLSPDKVVFVSVYTNSAWTYQHRTSLVLGDGRYYSFDYNFSFYPNAGVSEEEIVKLLKDEKPIAVIDKDYLLEMYEHGLKVNKDSEFTTAYARCDYGQETLYFVKDDGSLVKCASDGDTTYYIKDEHAQKVEKLWKYMDNHCKLF